MIAESFCLLLLKDRWQTTIRAGISFAPVLREFVVALAGVHNVTALGNLITWQKVDYDFNYHRMEFPCNINVLITSEGRSLLPVWEGGREGGASSFCQGQVGTGNVSCDQGGCDTGSSCCLLPRGQRTEMELPSSFLNRGGELVKDQGWVKLQRCAALQASLGHGGL